MFIPVVFVVLGIFVHDIELIYMFFLRDRQGELSTPIYILSLFRIMPSVGELLYFESFKSCIAKYTI